jgi:hypothetical protein
MSQDDFENVLRGIAQEVTNSVGRISDLEVEDWARTVGLDPERGKEWFTRASQWLHQATQAPPPPTYDTSAPADTPKRRAPLHDVQPHPLDLPGAEQGVALAALDSGRWVIEPGTSALAVHGDGPGPSDALGLVRSLRVRDWLRADGALTLAGRRALERWLAATA